MTTILHNGSAVYRDGKTGVQEFQIIIFWRVFTSIWEIVVIAYNDVRLFKTKEEERVI